MEMKINYASERTGGAYSERMLQKNKGEYKMPSNTLDEIKAAEEVKDRLEGVEVTISPEAEEFLADVRERKEAARIEKERFERDNNLFKTDNLFDGIGTQSSIISKALADMGFYNDLSDEETLNIDNLLVSITHGMNRVCGNLREEISDEEQLSSSAARFELESSTAALKQFAEKYVPEHMREFFGNLVNQYYEYNAKRLEGYQSTKEIASSLNAKIYDKTKSFRVKPMDEEEKMFYMAGKVKTEKADVDKAVKSWKECFKMLMDRRKTVEDAVEEMSDILNRLASGNSENQHFIQYIGEWNSFSIENAKSYWSALLL